ncbi:MAG: aconitate hydratase AcnA [Tepidisphaerales bacterium]
MSQKDPFGSLATLETRSGPVKYHRLSALVQRGIGAVEKLPFSIKVLLESLLRNVDGFVVTEEDVVRLASYNAARPGTAEVPFKVARVILQDFTGVPCVVDLAAMRAAVKRAGGDPQKINPLVPVDLVIDHSVQVDEYASPLALFNNAKREFERNRERYEFLKWGQQAFRRFGVVPPATGIVHQVNLEHLAKVVWTENGMAFPDTLVGTDSHTTMINGLGVVGWGVGGIEAEACMLGQPIYLVTPEVVGFKLYGRLPEGATATDLVLTITQMLRKFGVVEKFVEFYGEGLDSMTVADRATIANMAPEYGATMGFFPVDEQVLSYLRLTGRPEELVDLVERYCKAQGLWREKSSAPVFTQTLELDLGTVKPSLAGPRRPQDRLELGAVKRNFQATLTESFKKPADAPRVSVNGKTLGHGDVVIAAITSCTNTSNPDVMVAAGLLAKKAVERGLTVKPHVKTSLAPGSRVVTDYLEKAGLTKYLEALGFHTVGYGCTTCIGNSGPLPEEIARGVQGNDLVVASVLSGNRNFEGRINPHVRANYLASPPLVVAYAIAGSVTVDLATEPLGTDREGKPVYLRDIWPSQDEVNRTVTSCLSAEQFRRQYTDVGRKNEQWNAIPVKGGELFEFDPRSTYIQEPPYFPPGWEKDRELTDIRGARVLVMVGDSVTTDHISPAGDIDPKSPAGKYLLENGVGVLDFNSYGARRGNDRVMTRGTFANIRLRNLLAPGTEGGVTRLLLDGPEKNAVMSVYDASLKYKAAGVPLLVLAGKDYGMGSSRDWAAKGTMLLGVKAVIAESFERIHRSNLVGMGVLPLQYLPGQNRETLGLTGEEVFDIHVPNDLKPGQTLTVSAGGKRFDVRCRIDTPVEIEYYRNGGILQTVLKTLLKAG